MSYFRTAPLAMLSSFLVVSIPMASASDAKRSIDDAATHFKMGRLTEGKVLLESLFYSEEPTLREKAIIANRLAWFYDEMVGDNQTAIRYSRKVLEFALPDSDPSTIEAKKRLEKIKHDTAKYRDVDKLVGQLIVGAESESDAKHKIEKLEEFIEQNPGHRGIPVARHYIGKHNMYLENYYASYQEFLAVLEMRPGIIFLLPTESLMNLARAKWYYSLAHTGSMCIIIITILAVTILLIFSRFWEWLNPASLVTLPVVVIAWGAFLSTMSWVLNFFVPSQAHPSLPHPQFIQSAPFTPGSEILVSIFLYGLLGIFCSFLLATSTRRLKRNTLRNIMNYTLSFLFFVSIFTVFYLNECYNSSLFEEQKESLFPALTSHSFFREKDFEPYILTDPRAYPDLDMSQTTDRFFVNWVNQQYSIMKSGPDRNLADEGRQH